MPSFSFFKMACKPVLIKIKALPFWERRNADFRDGQKQKGPAARKEEAAHDPRGWIVPGHRQSDVAHRQAHQRTWQLLAFPTTDQDRAGDPVPMRRG
jgi:hypothetical protein